MRGSIARLNIPSTLGKLEELTRVVEHDNLLHNPPGTIQFAGGKNPSSTSSMSSKKIALTTRCSAI